MHTRYPRAAVAAHDPQEQSAKAAQQRPAPGRPLWATKSLDTRAGRLLGVRMRGTGLEVAIVPVGQSELRWRPAADVLLDSQAERWARQSEFKAER